MSTVLGQEQREGQLRELSRTLLENRHLILASNRGPVEHHLSSDQLRVTRGTGGVVTVLNALSKFVPFTCVTSAVGEGDRHAVTLAKGVHIPVTVGEQELFLRYVVSRRSVYNRYYNVFSNPFLWFVQHSMWDLPYAPNIDASIHDAWERGYVPVNRAFAEAIADEAAALAAPPVVMLHDYHLYLVGGQVRQAIQRAIIQHFIHIPWPSPRHWAMVPQQMREAILESLCSCDIVGFQTPQDASNFLLTCQDLLPEAKPDFEARTILFRDRTTLVRHYPVSIDVAALRELADSPEVRGYETRLRSLTREKVIVRVDRLEPSKNILRGFMAYELLLGRHPELLGRVTFLAFLVPSRTDIREYQRYSDEVMDIIQRINSTFRRGTWQPIRVFYQDNYLQAIAGMRLADVLLVNPVIDGMNLVAKEGPTVTTRNGVLILSETTGAYQQLAPGVIPISPVDLEGTTRALFEALTMGEDERARLSGELCKIIEQEDLTRWLHLQMEDLNSLAH